MDTSTLIIGVGAIMCFFVLMTLRSPSRTVERIYVPIDVPVRDKVGCLPIAIAIGLFLLLIVLIHG